MKRTFLSAIVFLCSISLLFATGNGSNIIGYGTKSVSMAGADVAWINDINAMNINPAGIAFANDDILGIHLGFYAPIPHHTDLIGNDKDAAFAIFPIPNLGYVKKISPMLTLGLGFFTHGGMGATYEDMITPFGTEDKYYGYIMNLKVTPTVAIRLSEKLAVGVTVEFDYGGIMQEILPNTSRPDLGFVGMSTDGLYDLSIGFRIGLLYKPSDSFSFGIAYLTASSFEFDGTMDFNYSAIPGMGDVTYDAVMTGLNWPQQVDVGITFKPIENLMIAADFTWMNWKKAMHEATIVFTNPTVQGFPEMEIVSENNWEDQYIFAVGIDYQINPAIAIQAGYNYGKNPIPAETLNALMAATVEHHISIGATYKTESGTEWQAGFTFVPYYEIEYTNPYSLFGPNTVSGLIVYGLNIGVNFAL